MVNGWNQLNRYRIEHRGVLNMKSIADAERRRYSESEALIRKITEEDPGYWDGWLTASKLKLKLVVSR